jgi:polysaccharide export outer membrane protein
MDGPTVPIVYCVSFVDPAGYFLATRVQTHNKDVIFVANAQAIGVEKFATFLNSVLSVPSNLATTLNSGASTSASDDRQFVTTPPER